MQISQNSPNLVQTMPFSYGEILSKAKASLKGRWLFLIACFLLVTFIQYFVLAGIGGLSSLMPSISILFLLIYFAVQLILTIGLLRIYLNIVEGKPAEFTCLFNQFRLLPRYFLATILFQLRVAWPIIVILLSFAVVYTVTIGFNANGVDPRLQVQHAGMDIPEYFNSAPRYQGFETYSFRAQFMRLVTFISGFLVFISIPYIIWQSLKYQFYAYNIIDKNLPIKEAFRESAKATQCHKFQLLLFFIILGLINILGIIPLGLGLIYTIPLSVLAYAHIYKKLAN